MPIRSAFPRSARQEGLRHRPAPPAGERRKFIFSESSFWWWRASCSCMQYASGRMPSSSRCKFVQLLPCMGDAWGGPPPCRLTPVAGALCLPSVSSLHHALLYSPTAHFLMAHSMHGGCMGGAWGGPSACCSLSPSTPCILSAAPANPSANPPPLPPACLPVPSGHRPWR